MAAVSHPNLALIFGAESWFGLPMLIVEHLPGGTLADRLAQGRLPVEDALDIASALTPALARLHDCGILHRDIKPTNIGFAGDGTPKLLDFGLARVIEAAQHVEIEREHWRSLDRGSRWLDSQPEGCMSIAGDFTGTLPYLSPEAVNENPPDASLDLWALCMVLYEMIAGRHPLSGGTPYWIRLRIAEADIPDIREFAVDVPTPVADFLQDALSPNRRRRPASARELGERLRVLRQSLLVPAL